jgi:hypothetical protein
MCAFMRSLVHVSTGPTDRSARLRFAASALSRASRPARAGRARVGHAASTTSRCRRCMAPGCAQARSQASDACIRMRARARARLRVHLRPLHARAAWPHRRAAGQRGRPAAGPRGARTGRDPVLVHEQDGLRAALLAAARVRVLVALPGHVVRLSHVGAQDLPVKAGVLQEDLRAGQTLSEGAATSGPRTSQSKPASSRKTWAPSDPVRVAARSWRRAWSR